MGSLGQFFEKYEEALAASLEIQKLWKNF